MARCSTRELTARVYLELVGGRQTRLKLAPRESKGVAVALTTSMVIRLRPHPLPPGSRLRKKRRTRISSPRSWVPTRCGRGVRPAASGDGERLSTLARLRAVQRREIDGLDHQRRHAAIANGIGHDPPREREEQMRSFDEKDRLQEFFGCALNEEQPAIDKLQQEHGLVVLGFGRDTQFEFNLVTLGVETAGLKVDTEIDLRPRGQRHRSAGILEGEILHILADDLDARALAT